MSWSLGFAVFTLLSAGVAMADDRQLVDDYLSARGASGAVVRPITDDYVGRTFSNISFFGVIFSQYPIAIRCPQTQDIKCANVFFVKDGQVDFAGTIPDLKFFFAAELGPVPTQDAAIDAAKTWLRFSEELKQDLFYAFGEPEISYLPRHDITRVRVRAEVSSGGKGQIELLLTLGAAGSFVDAAEKSTLLTGVRPICQATKLLDRDPIVRRMAEQDILVMGRVARPYLDRIRAKSRPKLQQAIDRIWQRILDEGR